MVGDAEESLPHDSKGRRALRAARLCYSNSLALWSDAALAGDASNPYAFLPLCCRKKWCPYCGPQWSKEMTTRLLARVVGVPHKELRHIVLTIKNPDQGNLQEGIGGMFEAWRLWRHYGRRASAGGWWRQVEGYAAKMEVHWTPKAGWHPHLHVLAHIPGGIDLRADSPARKAWSELTRKTCGHEAVSLWVSGVRSADIGHEVAKYCAKPVEGKRATPQILAELAEATAGRRWWSAQGTLECSEPDDPERPHLELIGSMDGIVHNPAPFEAAGWKPGEIVDAWVANAAKDPVALARNRTLRNMVES